LGKRFATKEDRQRNKYKKLVHRDMHIGIDRIKLSDFSFLTRLQVSFYWALFHKQEHSFGIVSSVFCHDYFIYSPAKIAENRQSTVKVYKNRVNRQIIYFYR
jgi:hypothetical protein